MVDSSRYVADSSRYIADNSRYIADSRRKIYESSRYIADSRRNIAESSRNIADSRRNIAGSSRNIADSSRNIAESSRNIADSRRNIAESSRNIAKNSHIAEAVCVTDNSVCTAGNCLYTADIILCVFLYPYSLIVDSLLAGWSGVESRYGRTFPHKLIPAMGSTQPPKQWVPGFSRE